MSKNKGGREVRKPKQEKKPKIDAQSSSALFARPADKSQPKRAK